MNRHARLAGTLIGALALALTACGSDDDGDAGVTATGDGSRVEVADSDLGEILVDGDGNTLYMFTMDSPGASACDEDCQNLWPPLEGEVDAGDGVDESLLGTIEHDDGTVQATYGDWPLYYYAADEGPGDLSGQGVEGVWYVLDPAGNVIEDEVEEQNDAGY